MKVAVLKKNKKKPTVNLYKQTLLFILYPALSTLLYYTSSTLLYYITLSDKYFLNQDQEEFSGVCLGERNSTEQEFKNLSIISKIN